MVDLLDRQLGDLDRHVAALQATRRQLADLTERARRLDPADCTDPNRCQTIGATSRALVAIRRPAHVHQAPGDRD